MRDPYYKLHMIHINVSWIPAQGRDDTRLCGEVIFLRVLWGLTALQVYRWIPDSPVLFLFVSVLSLLILQVHQSSGARDKCHN